MENEPEKKEDKLLVLVLIISHAAPDSDSHPVRRQTIHLKCYSDPAPVGGRTKHCRAKVAFSYFFRVHPLEDIHVRFL